MRSRSYPVEERAKMIADHYRRKAIKYKTGPSSEDVWDLRTEPVTGAFQGDFRALEREMEVAEQREEEERRRKTMVKMNGGVTGGIAN
jgi:hypothetical protein